MVYQFKSGEVIEGTTLVRTKMFSLVKTLDNNYVLINTNKLDNSITTTKYDTNDNKQGTEFDTNSREE